MSSLKRLMVLFVIFFLASMARGYCAEVGFKLKKSEVSPRGNLDINTYYDEDNNLFQVWIVDKRNLKRQLLSKFNRQPVLLFSPDQEKIAVEIHRGAGDSGMCLFSHVAGLEYRLEKLDLEAIFWSFFWESNDYVDANGKVTGEALKKPGSPAKSAATQNIVKNKVSPPAKDTHGNGTEDENSYPDHPTDVNISDFANNYIHAIAWAADSNALLVSLDGTEGNPKKYTHSWFCIYDFKNKQATLDMRILNRNAVTLKK